MTSRVFSVRRHRSFMALIAASAALLGATPASAAVQIGQTFAPDPTVPCGADITVLQVGTTPSGQYTVPSPGVITSWSFQAGASAPGLKLKVGRPQGGDVFTIVGDTELRSPATNTVNVFPARIAVTSGDVIGIYSPTGGPCGADVAGFNVRITNGDPPPGSTVPMSFTTGRLDLSAVVEADADGDAFGDETQDQCPGQAGPVNGCPMPQAGDSNAPNAQITKGPKQKTKKKTATFEFTGTDARAVASFQCKLDSGAFAPCTSPHTVNVKKGKHTFQVQAIDQAGNVGSPATDDWKVKKKRKK
jgi:hypothetical protein